MGSSRQLGADFPVNLRDMTSIIAQCTMVRACAGRGGRGSSIPDDAYLAQGAAIVATAEELRKDADLIFKVKEPQWLRGGRDVLMGGVPASRRPRRPRGRSQRRGRR